MDALEWSAASTGSAGGALGQEGLPLVAGAERVVEAWGRYGNEEDDTGKQQARMARSIRGADGEIRKGDREGGGSRQLDFPFWSRGETDPSLFGAAVGYNESTAGCCVDVPEEEKASSWG